MIGSEGGICGLDFVGTVDDWIPTDDTSPSELTNDEQLNIQKKLLMQTKDSIIELLNQLVQIPSRAGVDDYGPIAQLVQNWMQAHDLPCEFLHNGQQTVGLVAIVEGMRISTNKSPVIMLNATLDTAGYGDTSRWRYPPDSSKVKGGWMYGRGTADSKAGVAIFCHLAVEFAADRNWFSGRLVLLLDLDEHTGGFSGVRRYFDQLSIFPRPDGVFIGYPGNDRIAVGSRGFTRAELTVHGEAAHSGSASNRGVNAVVRAARLAQQLAELPLPKMEDDFLLPPQLTITAIVGGTGFSMVPDLCQLLLDVRLTPAFDARRAQQAIEEAVAAFDYDEALSLPTTIRWQPGWPAYHIPDDHPLVYSLRRAAEREFARTILPTVVGPSNIGNYLETLEIPVISGFGVTYRGIHAIDECIELASVEPIYRTYSAALRELFNTFL